MNGQGGARLVGRKIGLREMPTQRHGATVHMVDLVDFDRPVTGAQDEVLGRVYVTYDERRGLRIDVKRIDEAWTGPVDVTVR